MRAISKLIIASMAVVLSLAPLEAQATTYTVANVKGSYAFRFIGLDSVVTNSWIVGTGVFVADGDGNITGGSITYNDGGDVCTATVNASNGAYSVAADGEGTLLIDITPSGGTCPITPVFQFATALAAPKGAIAQTIEMNSTSVQVNRAPTTAVMIYGVGNLL